MSNIKITPLKNGEWALLEDVKILEWTIEKGFKFDGASIPRIAWTFVWCPMWTDVIRAALLHDYLYKTHKLKRKEADEMFNKVMLLDKVKPLKRIIYFLWVRLWWWLVYYFTWEYVRNERQLHK